MPPDRAADIQEGDLLSGVGSLAIKIHIIEKARHMAPRAMPEGVI